MAVAVAPLRALAFLGLLLPGALAAAESRPLSLDDHERAWIAAHPVIRLQMSENSPPFEFREQGEWKGLAYDYLREASQRLGLRVVPVEISWTDALASIRGKHDIDALLCVTKSPERERQMAMTEPYLAFPMMIFTERHHAVVSGLADLAQATIAVEDGYLQGDWLRRDLPHARFLVVKSTQEALSLVSSNKADAYVGNLAVASHLIDTLGLVNLKIAAPSGYGEEPFSVGVRQDWAVLAGLLDRSFASFTPDDHQRLRQRWLAVRYEYGLRPWNVLMVILGVASLAAGFIFQLRRMVAQRTAALAASELKFASTFRANPAAIAIIRLDGLEVLDANPALERLSGHARAALVGMEAARLGLFAGPDQRQVLDRLRAGQVVQDLECGFTARGGEVRIIRLAASLIDVDGARCILASIIDQSERHRAEADLARHRSHLEELIGERTADLENARIEAERLSRIAEQASQAKSRFLASMSHEIRTPLNAVLGYAQLMVRDPALPERHRHAADVINRSGDHLLGLINDILDMSRIESGHLALDESGVDLPQLFDNLHSLFALRAQERGLHLAFTQGREVPRIIRSDQRKLRQILFNLLSNAVKFTQAGSIVLATAYDPGAQRLEIRVTDTGPGIAADELPRLFQVFSQTQAGRASLQGAGLGLSISRGFARAMGGDLAVTSTLGQGTTFTLTLPAVPAATSEEALPARRSVVGLAPGSTRPRILIVDDQVECREVLADLMAVIGLETALAVNGRDAVERWRTFRPDVILMDITMPEVDGREATRLIRAESERDRPIIIALTAASFPEDQALFQRDGCQAFIAKPYREVDLLRTIEHLTGARFVWSDRMPGQPDPDTPATGAGGDLRPALLAADPALLQALRDALDLGDLADLARLARTLPDRALADALAGLAESFSVERLTWLLRPGTDDQGGTARDR